jgi:hypothetical protein
MADSDQLLIPDAAKTDPKSFELGVWVANKGQQVSLRAGVWKDPAAWGLMLADLARHVANSYQQDDGFDRLKTLQRIKIAFDAELASSKSARDLRTCIDELEVCWNVVAPEGNRIGACIGSIGNHDKLVRVVPETHERRGRPGTARDHASSQGLFVGCPFVTRFPRAILFIGGKLFTFPDKP